jgi:hypothetical protein
MNQLYTSVVTVCALLVTAGSTFVDAKTITGTITVKAGQSYDGNGETIICSGMGNGDDDENQKPAFLLERGASLSNVKIGAPGVDGIHCQGNNTLKNIVWEDIGEDALTVKKSNGTGDYVIIDGGSAKNGSDKCFQINATCTFTVKNFTVTNVGKFIRQNGDTDFKIIVNIINCNISAKLNIVRSDANSSEVHYCNSTFSNTSDAQFSVGKVYANDCGTTEVIASRLFNDSFAPVIFNASKNTIVLAVPANHFSVEMLTLAGKTVFHENSKDTSPMEFALPPNSIQNGSYIIKTTIDGKMKAMKVSVVK